jgi:hypothetical protein
MSKNLEHALEYSGKWLEIIKQETVPEDVGKWIIEESKYESPAKR